MKSYNRETMRIRLFLLIILCFVLLGTLSACNIAEKKQEINVTVRLQELTQSEYNAVGTIGIENPTINDFKKLTLRVDTSNLIDRKISFPSIPDIQKSFSSDVAWFSHAESQDNPSEKNAYYLLETTLFTRNITVQEIRDKLNSLPITVIHMDNQGNRYERIYQTGDLMVEEK